LSPVLGECLALEEVLPLLSAHNALMVLDESAALGNVGALGAGSSEILATNTLLNAAPLVARIADLSLTLCSYGGSIVCSGALRELVIQRSRAIGSESSLPPALAAAAERSLDLVELMPLARVCIGSLAERMRAGLRILNCSVFPSQSPIVSFEVQSLRIAREVVEALFRKGFLFELVQLSTSLRSRSVIRALISNAHSDDTISKALQALDEVLGRLSMDARRQA
jgi:7-keto-8-aminopelargonate synthetase-like enzyme